MTNRRRKMLVLGAPAWLFYQKLVNTHKLYVDSKYRCLCPAEGFYWVGGRFSWSEQFKKHGFAALWRTDVWAYLKPSSRKVRRYPPDVWRTTKYCTKIPKGLERSRSDSLKSSPKVRIFLLAHTQPKRALVRKSGLRIVASWKLSHFFTAAEPTPGLYFRRVSACGHYWPKKSSCLITKRWGHRSLSQGFPLDKMWHPFPLRPWRNF